MVPFKKQCHPEWIPTTVGIEGSPLPLKGIPPAHLRTIQGDGFESVRSSLRSS